MAISARGSRVVAFIRRPEGGRIAVFVPAGRSGAAPVAVAHRRSARPAWKAVSCGVPEVCGQGL
ncbi:hypothetical protein [Streptomyces sp. CC228A]|uniref:hypothetical protein n=1 Tax=Streptomyces sp. CC228A TaxID=2898186 RepID=UPI001F2C9CFD|nr:hypothetical protein [Streptomyces sp. CC228A]